MTVIRKNKILDLLNKLVDINDLNSSEQLVNISFELEKLYLEVDMPIRNADTVLRKIEQLNKIRQE